LPPYFAFLRAINVGGHTVKMDHLRQIFASIGFTGVETFIASGNVIFETYSQISRTLEIQIESALLSALGYSVAVFLRTPQELNLITHYMPFPQADLDAAAAFNVAFLSDPLGDAAVQKLMALTNEIDRFHVHGREVYWLCRKKQSESTFSNTVLEKTLRTPSTLRGVNTLQKMAAKYQEG
jgi:uncharacterized protein (DUF1697 family)